MPSPSPGRRPGARRCAALGLALLVTLSACRSDTDPSASPPRLSGGDAQASLASQPAPTRTRIHRVHGRLSDARRKQVREQVGEVVDGWWEAAYLGGSYPRTGFPSAFPGFTAGAEQRARADKALLTNETQAERIDSVTPRRRSVALDILATDGRARSVTAQFVLRFDTTGQRSATTTVRGRLFLVHGAGGWRVFGYDVAKGSK